MMQIDGICRAGLILNAEGGRLLGCIDHHVGEVICGRDVKLQRKRFVIDDAESQAC